MNRSHLSANAQLNRRELRWHSIRRASPAIGIAETKLTVRVVSPALDQARRRNRAGRQVTERKRDGFRVTRRTATIAGNLVSIIALLESGVEHAVTTATLLALDAAARGARGRIFASFTFLDFAIATRRRLANSEFAAPFARCSLAGGDQIRAARQQRVVSTNHSARLCTSALSQDLSALASGGIAQLVGSTSSSGLPKLTVAGKPLCTPVLHAGKRSLDRAGLEQGRRPIGGSAFSVVSSIAAVAAVYGCSARAAARHSAGACFVSSGFPGSCDPNASMPCAAFAALTSRRASAPLLARVEFRGTPHDQRRDHRGQAQHKPITAIHILNPPRRDGSRLT